MPNPGWHFRRKMPSDAARDPISSEFFANESVENAARAIVREAIQNSLDARTKSGLAQPVNVRLTIGLDELAANSGDADAFFTDAWSHLKAPRSKLQNPPGLRDRCEFLTIEDFGTSGLEGDADQWTPADEMPNAFYTFFRAEAYSEKAGDDRGRWGVGKLVFPRSSRASAFFGYTVQRSTGTALLMGRMILGHHSVNGVEYSPDAFFGIRKTIDGDSNFVAPIRSSDEIARFRSTFNVSRTTEPGLSVVVPWLVDSEEDRKKFEIDALARAVAAEYVLPILRGELTVSLARGRQSCQLDKDTLTRAGQPWMDEDVTTRLQLGMFAASVPNDQLFQAVPADQSHSPRVAQPPLKPDQVARARRLLEEGKPVAFDLPIRVLPKGGSPRPSSFRVHMMPTESADHEVPVFVRDGITITNAKGSRVPKCATLVTIDEGPLASLLGDSENPAHTEWLPNTRQFKAKYTYASSFLRYVKDAPRALFDAIFTGDRSDDPFVLADFFPDIQPALEKQPRPKREEQGTPGPEPVPPAKPRTFSVRRVNGGFEVRRGTIAGKTPHRLRIRVAYDVRRGSPLKRYEEYDFDVAKAPIKLQPTGVSILQYGGNEIVVAPDVEDFKLDVTGFDENRDLYVKVEASEDEYEH